MDRFFKGCHRRQVKDERLHQPRNEGSAVLAEPAYHRSHRCTTKEPILIRPARDHYLIERHTQSVGQRNCRQVEPWTSKRRSITPLLLGIQPFVNAAATEALLHGNHRMWSLPAVASSVAVHHAITSTVAPEDCCPEIVDRSWLPAVAGLVLS